MASTWLSQDRPRLFGSTSSPQGHPAVRGAAFQGGGSFKRGLGRGLRGTRSSSRCCGVLSYLFPTQSQEEGTAKEASVPSNPELVVA